MKSILESRVDDPLVYVRAIHFAATLTVAGVVFFIVSIGGPASRLAGTGAPVACRVRTYYAWIAWIGWILTVLSGAAWLVLVASAVSDRSLADVLTDGTVWTLVSQTGFGRDWLQRFFIACLLAVLLVPFLAAQRTKSLWLQLITAVLAAGLVGSLAWAGHAVGAEGIEGIVHPTADVLHLIAAAAWVGTLLPLAVLLAAGQDTVSFAVARIATVRFSNLGIASVATLLVTGSINTWYLAGSVPALTETDYGRLLLVKIAAFFGMVAIAAFNRLRLTPRLVQDAGNSARSALWQLRRTVAVEIAAGAIVIVIVAALGVTPPGHLEAMMPQGHHH
jgi:copper resistance protein D